MATITERRLKAGKIVFEAELRPKGFPRTYRTFDRLTDARAWVQEMEYNVRSGQHITLPESKRHTLAEAIDRYSLEELPKKPKIFRDQKRLFLWFKEKIGFKTLADVSPALLTRQ